MWGIPWQSQVRTQLFHCSRAWVQTLIQELRSCAARPKKKKKKTFIWLIYLCNLEIDSERGAQKIFCESTQECYDNLSIV